MSSFICPHCGMINIDCGDDGFKTQREIELEEAIISIFKTLIICNYKYNETIKDTNCVDIFTELWDYLRFLLNMDDNEFVKFKKQTLKQAEQIQDINKAKGEE